MQLSKDLWFMHHEEKYQYTEFEENNLLLEDDAILCNNKNKKKRYLSPNKKDEASTSTESDSVYDDMFNIQHNVGQSANAYSSDDSSSLDSFSRVHFLL